MTEMPAPPPAASTAPPIRPAPTAWTWRHVLLAAILLTDFAYAMLIVAGIGFGEQERLVPPQISQIIVGALAASTVVASVLLICGRLGDRVETAVVILGGICARIEQQVEDSREAHRLLRGEVAALHADVCRRGETTEDLSGRQAASGRVVFVARSPVYEPDPTVAAASWTPSQPVPRGGTHDAVDGGVETAPVREAFMHGYRLGQQHKANGGDNVLPMPPAHGG